MRYLSYCSLILIKFAATMHNSRCNLNSMSVHSQKDDNAESFNFLLFFTPTLVKYANIYDIFADVWPILMKFCMIAHISYTEHNTCTKVKFKKDQDSRCCCLKKLSNAIYELLFHCVFAAGMHISHCNFNSMSVHS